MKKISVISVAFLVALPGVCWATPVQMDLASNDADKESVWVLSAEAEDVAIGRGLPVLALGRPDWPNYRLEHSGIHRAMRSLRAELIATNPAGWRFATLARSEAWIEASEDAVTVAALEVNHADPASPRSFRLAARSQSWQGLGLKMGTPWWSIGDAGVWRWQADAQLFRLKQLRTAAIAGDASYRGAGVYDFNLQSERANENIKGRFLPASGSNGMGASLSLALAGEPVPGLQIALRADDLFSRLQWKNLATDANVLNSQVTSRAADGSLDYAALLRGRKTLATRNERIGAHWQAKMSWQLSSLGKYPGAMTLRADDQAGIRQYWLGWENSPANKASMRWVLELEPQLHALSAGWSWGNWRAALATDGKGKGTEYRRVSVSWGVGL